MEIPPTAAPPLAQVSLAPTSAPYINSLASSLNPHWGQPPWVPTPTLVETQVLNIEQRLEDTMGPKIAEAMSKKDHLRTFVDLIRLQVTLDAIMCRAFPPTLRQEAREWVATLPPNSIRTFDDFSKNFATYFASSKRAKKTAIGLMQLTQDEDEMLKDFIT
ncbi:S-locus glycoprotein [Abeliophyllum distichum]|uniref:S-locus glycoprotein n=1 Tax=Abeliophyllum distichum TaxID=126358 RepID=A0ABD1RZS3_9LAMI